MKSLSQEWYTPQEIVTLRLWLAIAVVVNLFLSTIEWIRGDHLALQLSLIATFALGVVWLVLPDGEHAWKRDVALGKSGLVLVIGVLHFSASRQMWIDIWSYISRLASPSSSS